MSSESQTKLVVLAAPSGTGKSTLAAMLLARQPNFQLSISHTTRAPRGEEKHGKDYYFVDQAEFRRMIDAGDFLEYALVFGKNYYGTSRKAVESWLAANKNVLFDIDVQGAASLKNAFGARCVTVFILPPSMQELEQRLRNRKTESPEAIELRLKTAREEMKVAPHFDYRIVNQDLEPTYTELKAILKKEGCI